MEANKQPADNAIDNIGDGADNAKSIDALVWRCAACGFSAVPTTGLTCTKCGKPATNPGPWPPSEPVRRPMWFCAAWRPALYVHCFPPTPGWKQHGEPNLVWTMTANDDWLFTASWDYQLMVQLLAHGLFTIPDAPGTSKQAMLMLPNPLKRYCIDFRNPGRRWESGKEMRAIKRTRYRMSVNRHFSEGLEKLMHGHNERSSTWWTPDLIKTFEKMNSDESSPVKHWLFELWVCDENDNADTGGNSDSGDHNAETSATAADTESLHLAEATAASATAIEEGSTMHASRAPVAVGDDDEHSRRSSRNEQDATGGEGAGQPSNTAAPARSQRWELAAVTAGMSVGREFHDYSMLAFIRDKRNLGHVLTKSVGDLLAKCGFDLWYWGFKNGYMSQYDS